MILSLTTVTTHLIAQSTLTPTRRSTHPLRKMEARAGSTHHRLGSVSPYGYTPSLAPSLAYLVVFSVLTLAHIVMGIRYKYWIVFVTLVPGGLCE